ncbi:MAG: FecR domain-containing protein, partial [Pseudorhizobium sp.]
MPYARLLQFVFLFLITFGPVTAFAQDWVVSRTTRQVSYTVDKTTWETVAVGTVIPSKAWVATGPRGRVTLTRGEESLSLSPNTMGAVITTDGVFSRKTEVVQQTGEIALDIEKRSRPHTYVHTPFLAAVVKGTSFTVTVTARDATVSVESGLVQVSSFTGGETADVGPGQQATVDQNQAMSVAGVDAAPSVTSVEPTRASVPAVNQPAPLGAGLGLSAFGEQSAQSGDGGSNGVSGESSGDGGYTQAEQSRRDTSGSNGTEASAGRAD